MWQLYPVLLQQNQIAKSPDSTWDKTSFIIIPSSWLLLISIQLYGCTTRSLTKCPKKRLDENYTKILMLFWTIPGSSNPKKQKLYSHLSLISQIILVGWASHVGHNWRRKNSLITFSYRFLYMETPILADWQNLILTSSVKTLNVM